MRRMTIGRSLKSRVVLFISTVTFLCVLFAVLIISIVGQSYMGQIYQAEKEAILGSLGQYLPPLLDYYEYNRIESTLVATLSYPSVVSIAVYDREGGQIRSTVKRGESAVDIVKRDIVRDGNLIGRMVVSFTPKPIRARILFLGISLASGMVGFFILMGMTLLSFVDRLVLHPLGELSEAATRTTPENMTVRVTPRGPTEIMALAERFNAMTDRLAAYHDELQRYQEELEARVRQRTAELEVSKEKAEAADRLKSSFLAAMSHELRTPLNSIIGFTGILLQQMSGPLNTEQEKQLKMVKGSSQHLLNLINDVLDISKIAAGQIEVYRQPFDMRASIEKSIAAVRPLAEGKGLVLTFEVAPDVGLIVSDQRRVEQVLLNLLSNAVKFTDSGLVALRAEIRDGRLLTVVRDTGIGIKAADFGKLFKPFQQLDSGTGRLHEGTGLGLSISRRLLQLLGGDIQVESTWGKGSCFSFSLPIEQGGGA